MYCALQAFYMSEDSPDKMTVASSLNWTQLTFCVERKNKSMATQKTERNETMHVQQKT